MKKFPITQPGTENSRQKTATCEILEHAAGLSAQGTGVVLELARFATASQLVRTAHRKTQKVTQARCKRQKLPSGRTIAGGAGTRTTTKVGETRSEMSDARKAGSRQILPASQLANEVL